MYQFEEHLMNGQWQERKFHTQIAFSRNVGSNDPLVSTIEVGDRVALSFNVEPKENEVLVRVIWCEGSALRGIVEAIHPRAITSKVPFQLGSEVAFDKMHVFRLQKGFQRNE